jgi:hypothetical protein
MTKLIGNFYSFSLRKGHVDAVSKISPGRTEPLTYLCGRASGKKNKTDFAPFLKAANSHLYPARSEARSERRILNSIPRFGAQMCSKINCAKIHAYSFSLWSYCVV